MILGGCELNIQVGHWIGHMPREIERPDKRTTCLFHADIGLWHHTEQGCLLGCKVEDTGM